jgi:serine/threonine-protein kinase HipA
MIIKCKFQKRFDRIGHNKKLALEGFAQLSNEDRHTKYNSSMEKVITVIEKFCTFPKIEFVKLFKLTLFNFLVGNEDMHLKNFSLITKNKKISLSPAYDLLNSTISQKNAKEEIALPIRGRKSNLTKRDFFDYFAVERLGLNPKHYIFDCGKINHIAFSFNVMPTGVNYHLDLISNH